MQQLMIFWVYWYNSRGLRYSDHDVLQVENEWIIDVLGHETTWENEMNFVMNHISGKTTKVLLFLHEPRVEIILKIYWIVSASFSFP